MVKMEDFLFIYLNFLTLIGSQTIERWRALDGANKDIVYFTFSAINK